MMLKPPPVSPELSAALERTWPPAREERRAGWALRFDPHGGRRTSAATRVAEDPPLPGEIDTAEAAMRAARQDPLFRVREGEAALNGALEARGYVAADATLVMAARTDAVAARGQTSLSVVLGDFPLALQEEFWAARGIGPGRLAVMARAPAPKTYLLRRGGDGPAGAAFCACEGTVAVLHALEVDPERRRAGHGRSLMIHAAGWARDQGAETLALAVTRGNAPARALYEALGFAVVGSYHYRRAPA